MKKFLVIFLIAGINKVLAQQPSPPKLSDKYVLVIHGGAGTILKENMTPEKERAYNEGLELALQTGYTILKKGGTALDAIEATVRLLEDNPLFNAGKGAVFTNAGKNELDAAIMDGKTLGAGSVAGVTTIRNPISAARAVMEKSLHVMMAGKGAEQFAAEHGLEIVDPSYFFTKERWQSLQNAKAKDSIEMVERLIEVQKKLDSANNRIDKTLRNADSVISANDSLYKARENLLKDIERLKKELKKQGSSAASGINHDEKFGTVGAVALDRHGNLAAATSTGGMTNKRFGRIGDAPIIGSGTYANNKTVAISCTGWGEYYIRLVMAKSISDMMEFGKMSLKVAADDMVMKQLPDIGGDGGLIAVDRSGNIAMPFCTAGMYRGYVKQDGKKVVKIYKE